MLRSRTCTLAAAARIGGLALLLAPISPVAAGAGLAAAPLDGAQRKCVNAVNGAFAKAIGKANEAGLKCLRRISKGAESAGFAACSEAADLSSAAGKVARAVEKKCEAKGVSAESTFAYRGDAASVATAAIEAARGVHAELLGDPAAVAPKSSKRPAACQKTALGELARYLDALARSANQAKKRSLKGKRETPAASAEDLAAALLAAPDSKKAQRSLSRASKRVARKCEGEDVAGLFGGSCGGASAGTLADCAAVFARCRFCQALAAADGLPLDCESFSGDASCAAASCGNGALDEGEACDDGNLVGGDGCRADCTEEICGDGILDPTEGCDDGNSAGGDGCDASCVSETCGDGVVDELEACDDGNTDSGDGCRANCTEELCGDTILDEGEACDDGDTASGDGCRDDCTLELCGDGILDEGEACDDGNNSAGDGCRDDCSEELCGDGVVDVGEPCDDGNQEPGDGCSETCALEACGDGVLGSGEACDDGNQEDGDGCRANCSEELCGDGILDAGEACDDGNTEDGDGCRSDCSQERCGDGTLDAGEQCDDGNQEPGDGCDAECHVETCGDGSLDAGEACDDGNQDDGDGCRADCTEEVCGDGIVDAGEECDDGDTEAGDGCSETCTVEGPVAPPDANFNTPLRIPLDGNASVTDFVSYPGGDSQDKVRWDVLGMNQNPSFPGGRAQLTISASCFGTGTQHVQFFTGGQTFSCGQTIVSREVTYDTRTGQVTITAAGGSETYVQWVLTGTAVRVE